MALFFDAVWFDAQLAARHLTRGAVGAMLGLDETGVGELWKDQRELKADDVALIAALFSVTPEEVANRAGISTPVPQSADPLEKRLTTIDEKLDRILKILQSR